MAGPPRCSRCLLLEDELSELRQQLAAVGRYVVTTPGPNTNPDLERELKRWLAVNPRADAAEGFRAGWARLARFIGPRLRDWEGRWFRAMRDNDRLRARLGSLLRELSRLNDPR
ncbi:MAG TPA: hypothetical protein VGJ60_19045 [Chloroflexota bacterium]